MILVIDNYDSFTYNLVQYLGELGAEVRVSRNDQISVEEAAALRPTHIVISPGPGTPDDAGISKEIIRVLGVRIPILGVCLGQQCIGEVYGGSVVRATQLMHGKTSLVRHNGKDLFNGIPTPLEAARYHSLIVTEPLPPDLLMTAWTEAREVMGLRHKQYPIHGVQFHPESFLTSHGKEILANFIAMQPLPLSRSSEAEMLKPFIAKLLNRQDLTAAEAENAMGIIMTGQATPAQIGGYLVALRLKHETVEEITGSVRAMRAQASAVPFELNGHALLDTAGTGGDGKHSFNISTAAAFVIAATGRKVAKHGNRAASSQCGSADVLGVLGVNLDLTPEQVAACIREVGIGFMFAPKFHPAMKYAIGPRKELGQRTIFNLLGPLTNPAGATHQLIGVYDPALTRPLAEVLCELGSQAAFVIHGHGGLDELTTSGPNQVSQLRNGKVETFELNASDYGLKPASSDHLYGGTPEENATRMRSLLAGKDDPACVDVILFNAAAALATEIGDFKLALVEARAALESGKALAKLNELIGFSQKFALIGGLTCLPVCILVWEMSLMNILDEIFSHKREEVALRKQVRPLAELRAEAEASPQPVSFVQTLQAASTSSGRPALIAEVKFASPSRGVIIQHPDPLWLAEKYDQAGAAAISVLTDEKYFHGCLEYLRNIHQHFPSKPLLRKDFILDPYQVYEARAVGASAILLIAAHLDTPALVDLHVLAHELGLDALIEVHDRAELGNALKVPGMALMGVNNRDLRTFEVNLQTCLDLRPFVPKPITFVAESGIHNREDVRRLSAAGVDAMLVGEALVTSHDVVQAIHDLYSREA